MQWTAPRAPHSLQAAATASELACACAQPPLSPFPHTHTIPTHSRPALAPTARLRSPSPPPRPARSPPGGVTETHQYSVSEYAQPLGRGQLPALDVQYDLSPIVMTINESPPSLLHFLVRVCAVLGGVFAITREQAAWGVHWGWVGGWLHRGASSVLRRSHILLRRCSCSCSCL